MSHEQTVQLFDGNELWQVPTITRNSEDARTAVIVCGETRPFRFLGRQLKFANTAPSEIDILELGCSTGETTVHLTKRFRKVIGVDISAEMMAKPAGPNLDLRLMDVLSDLDSLNKLIVEEFPQAKCCFFVDIGGDRLQDTVLLLLAHLIRTFQPMFIVLKCRKLYRTLLALPADVVLEDQWELNYQQAVKNTREERMRLHPKRFGLSLVPGTEQAICRYYNYKSCAKAEECEQNHTHCHFCHAEGHRARDCELFATELLFIRKG